jgi:hypothetical protein
MAQRPATGSATGLLVQGFKEVATFFDGRPRALGGFQDAYDQRAEVVFQAMLQRSPVSGVAFATAGAGGGTIGFAFDSPKTITQTLPRLMQLAGGPGRGLGTAVAPALNWREVPFPDGSGWMKLPDGWKITFAHKGMVSAMGPHGVVERAIGMPAKTRANCAHWLAISGGRPCPGFVADPTDPVSVLQAYNSYININLQRSGKPLSNIIRVNEVAPFQAPNFSQSAYIDLETEQGGIRYRGIQLVMLGIPSMDGMWLLYMSYASSRSESFAQNLPVLIEIWKSARTAQWVTNEALENAMNSLREAGEIWRRSTQTRERVEQRIHDKWTEVFRGTRIVEDTQTGRRGDVDLAWSTDFVRKLNEREGYGRYREVPLWQFNQ